jgi:hypothetical protein
LAQLPPRYHIVPIENDLSNGNYAAQINDRGQIVYDLWLDGGNTDAIDIFLNDNGMITRLTDDNVYDRQPDINNDGTIVWSRATNGPGSPAQIVMWRDGVLTQLTHSPEDNLDPRINNLGHVVWCRWRGYGCEQSSADIMFFDGQSFGKSRPMD